MLRRVLAKGLKLWFLRKVLDYSLKLFTETEVILNFGLEPSFTSELSFGLKL